MTNKDLLFISSRFDCIAFYNLENWISHCYWADLPGREAIAECMGRCTCFFAGRPLREWRAGPVARPLMVELATSDRTRSVIERPVLPVAAQDELRGTWAI